jgi:hypothetical protein
MAVTFINSTGANIATAASTWSIPTHSSRVGGAAMVLGLGFGSSAVSVSTVTDNAGNVWKLAVAVPGNRPGGAELWYATNLSSNSTRVSVTLSGASSGGLALGQFDGVSTANALAAVGSSAQIANSTTFGASQITVPADGVAVSFGRLQYSTLGTITNNGGMTTWISTASMVRSHGMYLLPGGAASTAQGQFTCSSRGLGAAVIAAFSDTVVAGGGAFQFCLMGVQ